MEEVERLNPQLKWDRRKVKRVVNKRVRALNEAGYAWGCRGHPGEVTELNWYPNYPYSSDCTIKSLIDGVEESCSMFHCNPQPCKLTDVQPFVDFAKEAGLTRANIKFDLDNYRYWEGLFHKAKLNGGNVPDPHDSNRTYKDEWALSCKTAQEYMNLSDEDWDFYQAELVAQGKNQ